MSDDPSLPMILRSARSGEVLRVNPAFSERLGLTNTQLGARPFLDWIHVDDRAALREALDEGHGYARARHRTLEGDWVELDWRVRSDVGGTVALGLGLCETSEASPRTLGDDTTSRATLAVTLEGMARVVEAKNPGLRCSILLVDASHEVVTVGAGPSLPAEYNAAVEGLRIGPAVGSCGTAAYWNVPVVVESIAEDPLWQDLRGAAAIAGVAACWSHPITATDGDVLGAMALYDRVPSAPTQRQMDGLEIAARMVGLAVERDRLEQQLYQAAKMEAIGVLAGGVAHDFNNMLATVLGNVELAQATLPEASEARPLLDEIATASLSAAELCNQMLAYAGRGSLVVETIECNALVSELGSLLRVALSKSATLDYELRDEAVYVFADRSQMRQVVMNLITNASEAIGDADGRITVSTCTRELSREAIDARYPGSTMEPGEYALLEVRDTGVGMGESTQARIFDPFFTTKSAGRGLGLAAVQGIVHRHKGAIAVESDTGSGTAITVLLPSVAEPSARQDEPAAVAAPTAGGRILVVDDEPNVRKVFGAMLEHAGYDAVLAADGEEAIDVFENQGDSIDCVLLDLTMPRMDGEQVFHELRRMRPDVRIVLSSGFTESEIMLRFQGAGLDGAIQKPARMQLLLEKLADAMQTAAATP